VGFAAVGLEGRDAGIEVDGGAEVLDGDLDVTAGFEQTRALIRQAGGG
jgi:hypothetical protein